MIEENDQEAPYFTSYNLYKILTFKSFNYVLATNTILKEI